MIKRISPQAYKKIHHKRVRAARELSGMEPEEIAQHLGISKDQYLRYESRYMMRHDLIIPFCQITETNLSKFLTPPAIRTTRALESV